MGWEGTRGLDHFYDGTKARGLNREVTEFACGEERGEDIDSTPSGVKCKRCRRTKAVRIYQVNLLIEQLEDADHMATSGPWDVDGRGTPLLRHKGAETDGFSDPPELARFHVALDGQGKIDATICAFLRNNLPRIIEALRGDKESGD